MLQRLFPDNDFCPYAVVAAEGRRSINKPPAIFAALILDVKTVYTAALVPLLHYCATIPLFLFRCRCLFANCWPAIFLFWRLSQITIAQRVTSLITFYASHQPGFIAVTITQHFMTGRSLSAGTCLRCLRWRLSPPQQLAHRSEGFLCRSPSSASRSCCMHCHCCWRMYGCSGLLPYCTLTPRILPYLAICLRFRCLQQNFLKVHSQL